jgi:hypothetical protein
MTAPDPRSDDPFLDVRAGLDGRSRLTAAWIDGGHFFATPSTVNVATGTIFGLGRRQVLAQSANLPGGVRDPALSVARNGRAIVAWRSFGQGGERVSIAIRSRPGARFRVLTALAGDSYVPPVAMLASGYGVVVNRQRAIVVRPDDSLGASRRLLGAQSTDGVGVAAVGRRLTLVWGARNGLRSATFTP